MPDLHGWITQQIDRAAAVAQAAGGKAWHWEHGYGDMCNDPTCPYGDLATDDTVLMQVHGLDVTEPWQGAEHIAFNHPAAVLRRSEADRKILARHTLDPEATWYEAAMCRGCGDYGEQGYPYTENLNDCPELLDLAYAHGLTPEILASLDRPQEGDRPERTGPSLIPDALAEAFSTAMLNAMTTRLVAANTPSPTAKALEILGPELVKIPGYVPTDEEQQPG